MKLKFIILLSITALVGSAVSGCNLFRRSKTPKENPAIAAELASDFQQRWLEQRAAELVATGLAAPAARTQAEREFGERFPHLLPRGR